MMKKYSKLTLKEAIDFALNCTTAAAGYGQAQRYLVKCAEISGLVENLDSKYKELDDLKTKQKELIEDQIEIMLAHKKAYEKFYNMGNPITRGAMRWMRKMYYNHF